MTAPAAGFLGSLNFVIIVVIITTIVVLIIIIFLIIIFVITLPNTWRSFLYCKSILHCSKIALSSVTNIRMHFSCSANNPYNDQPLPLWKTLRNQFILVSEASPNQAVLEFEGMSRNVSRVDKKFQSDSFFLCHSIMKNFLMHRKSTKKRLSDHFMREAKVPLKNPAEKFFRLICKIGTQLMPRMQWWLEALGHQRRRVRQHHHRHNCCHH